MSYHNGLLKALESGTGERGVHRYLKTSPRPIIAGYCRGWNFHYCIPEFRFADDYRADFLVLGGHSGGFTTSFIELEAPNARLYLKNGTPSKTLRIALRQIEDWRIWIRDNDNLLRKAIKKSLPNAMSSSSYLMKPSEIKEIGQLLFEQDMGIWDDYHIIIGRRKDLTSEDKRRRNFLPTFDQGVEIATYDRLLDIAWLQDKGERELRNARNTRKQKSSRSGS